ncbi:MAG: molybdopterin-dependent oxidoreductase [Myxococcales bacterium]|nr:molybdopterin-dependent oxidoreductase [Myxococcales bacterium]
MAAPRPSHELRALEHTFCRICEALCGLEAEVEGGRVVQLRPDAAHVATRGYACVKGLRQAEYLAGPDRLRYPLARAADGSFRRVSWDDALARVGAVVAAERAIHPDRVAMYVGTAAGFGVLHPIFAQGFMSAVGSRSMFSSATQDCASKFAAATHLYGFPFTQPFPDLDHARALVVVGANPAISKWSFLQVSNPLAKLREMEARGCRIVFVDPRRTESAKAAGEHVFIRPGTDAFFYLAFLAELVARDARGERVLDHERIARFSKGWRELAELAAPWTPERVADVTGIAPATLRRVVDLYLEGTREGGAALYLSTGVNMGPHGSIGFWLQEAINLVTGNTDRRGGTLVGQGILDFPAFGARTGTLLRKDRSRIGAFRSVNDAFPGGILADEILTPGERQIRVLFVTGGNPLLTMAGSARLAEAFAHLELLVCLDVLPSETAHAAHVVLPCTSPLQRPDLPFVFPLMLGLQSKPYLQATRAVEERQGEQRDEATIYLDLCRAAGLPIFGSKVAQRALEGMKALHTAKLRRTNPRAEPALPEERLLDLVLRATKQGSFASLLAHPHGRARPAHAPGSFLGARVVTGDGLVDLAPPPLVDFASSRLERDLEAERALLARGALKLITRRAVTTHNSWMHNHEAFVRDGTNHLYMHGDDLTARGLAEGELVDVRSATGTVRLPVRRLDDLLPGVVALPHGWGHQRAPGLRVASRTRGVNVNLLAADGPEALEPVSGMAHLTGIVVEVERAAGPQAATWSGLPE